MHEVFIVCAVCHDAWYRQSTFLFAYTENMALIMASVLCHLYSHAYILAVWMVIKRMRTQYMQYSMYLGLH